MAKTPGFVQYVDDRDDSITDILREDTKRSAAEWFEDSRIDSNGVTRTYLFSKDNHDEFKQLMKKHDDEFIAWLGGAKR